MLGAIIWGLSDFAAIEDAKISVSLYPVIVIGIITVLFIKSISKMFK